MAHEIEGVGQVEIGPDPKAKAEMVASLIRQDVKTGGAQPPGDHVKFVDKKGPDKGDTAWKTPSSLNATGKGNCNSITRAAAPHVNASHVAVVPVPQPDGERVDHAFLIAEAKPGDKPLNIDADGKAIGPIPADRIIDPNIKHGANDGKPLPAEVYQGASIEPIWPEHTRDLSHVHAPAPDRAAEGNAYQGVERAHAPATPDGVKTAEVSHLAARVVTPPIEHTPRPVNELYPTHHPVLDEVGKRIVPIEAAGKRALGFKPTLSMLEQYHGGLDQISQGVNPAPIPGDPPITTEHQEAAQGLKDHLMDLAGAQRNAANGGPDASAVASLQDHVTKIADKNHPDRDVLATRTAEIDAMIPGAVPPHITKLLPPSEDDASPVYMPASKAPVINLERLMKHGSHAFSLDLEDDEEEDMLPLYIEDDKEQDLGALGSAEWLTLLEALSSWCVGHPHDGRRRAPPPRPGASPEEAPPPAGPPGPSESEDPPMGGFWGSYNAQRHGQPQRRYVNGRWEYLVNGRWEYQPASGSGGYGGYGSNYGGSYRPGVQPTWGGTQYPNHGGYQSQGSAQRYRMRENAAIFSAPGNGQNLGMLTRGSAVTVSPTRRNAMFQGRQREWVYVTQGNRRGWTFNEAVEMVDPRMGAIWNYRRDGWGYGGWRRPVIADRTFVDDLRFRKAYAAVTSGLYTRYYTRILLSGRTVHGYNLRALRLGAALRGLTLPDSLASQDPPLQGPGFGGAHINGRGFGGGGGYGRRYGGGYGPVTVISDYGSACVDPTDPNDPCYDPSLGGTGDKEEAESAPSDSSDPEESSGVDLPSWMTGDDTQSSPSLNIKRAFEQSGSTLSGCPTGKCNA